MRLALLLFSASLLLAFGAQTPKAPTQEVKQKRLYPMGERIFTRHCKAFQMSNFKEFDALKSALDLGLCGNRSAKEREALLYYIWDIKIQNLARESNEKIAVPSRAKCPVCGMFVDKYPRFAAKVTITSGESFYFDGIKDLLKFITAPKEYLPSFKGEVARIDVSDYYTLRRLDAKEAVYVIGSDIFGPMGRELIPFESRQSAEGFIKDHGGEILESFDKIPHEILQRLE